MSLYTDSDVLVTADMTALDAEVPDIAAAEGLTVEGDGSVIRQAWDECADELLAAFQRFSGDLAPTGDQLYSGYFGVDRARVALPQVLVTEPARNRVAPIKRWMIYRALQIFYRAAMNRRQSDRYEEKFDRFSEDAKKHWRYLLSSGLPVVLQPLPCPGADHEWGVGTFGSSNVTSTPGGTDPQTAYVISITWVDGSKYVSQSNRGNAESGPSRFVSFTVPVNQWLRVNITGLTPTVQPDRGSADNVFTPLAPTGWNVYVGSSATGPLYLQNASPIPIGTATHTLSAAPVLSGNQLQHGQHPDALYSFRNLFMRG